MVKYTPGPWVAKRSLTSDGVDFWSVLGADGGGIVYTTLRGSDALAMGIDESPYSGVVIEARAAIAKAKGA